MKHKSAHHKKALDHLEKSKHHAQKSHKHSEKAHELMKKMKHEEVEKKAIKKLAKVNKVKLKK